MTAGYQLPVKPETGGKKTEGFTTPTPDKNGQVMLVPPQRVIPIVFLPGIMGSNLKMSEQRRRELGEGSDVAWRPDSFGSSPKKEANRSPSNRQLRLDPSTTTVDIYAPDREAAGEDRYSNVKVKSGLSPLLLDDPPTAPNRRTAAQKARLRGWSEVYFGSYKEVLTRCESMLNSMFVGGKLNQEWKRVVGVDPAKWGLDGKYKGHATPVTEDDLKKISKGTWYPVYAFGYNWLQSNADSALQIADRIKALMASFTESKFECKKVIVVTHSMGGLVGRALVHGSIGKMADQVAGVVHGVMPANGAAAAYKRILAGFEDPGLASLHPIDSIANKIIGNYGYEVTPVLASAAGGIQLLPSKDYGNGWLRIVYKGKLLDSWPEKGDPYEEIYKVRGKWWSLLNEEWLNPCGRPPQAGGASINKTFKLIDQAKEFHGKLSSTYHPCTYSHYGAGKSKASFANVVWKLNDRFTDVNGWQNWKAISNDGQGTLTFKEEEIGTSAPMGFGMADVQPIVIQYQAAIQPPSEAGDGTVPFHSADDQRANANVKAAFLQDGYDHQSSYEDDKALNSTLYSIVKIALANV